MNLSIYSQEDIERAKKRGRAYLCTSCYHKSERQVKKIDEKGRIEDHILKTHVTPGRWPYYCTLCLFPCTRREQLNHHVTNYQRHMDMASVRQIKDGSPLLVESPYKISELDYAKPAVLFTEAWLKRCEWESYQCCLEKDDRGNLGRGSFSRVP